MGVEIPAGFGMVLHSYRLTASAKIQAITYGFSPAAGETPAQMATFLHNAWSANVGGDSFIDSDYTFEPTEIRFNDPVDGIQVAIAGTASVGLLAGERLPPNCAVLVRKITAIGGHAFRGRIYLPPCFISEGNINEAGILNAADRTVVQDRINTWEGIVVTGSYGLILLHSSVLVAPTPITSWIVDSQIATQRRRLRP